MTAATPCLTADPALFEDETGPWPAKSLCLRCLGQYTCRWNALHTDVAGVVGGLTEAEREKWRKAWGVTVTTIDANDFLDEGVVVRDQSRPGRGARQQSIAIIRRRTVAGESATQIALALGISDRAVVRLRAAATT